MSLYDVINARVSVRAYTQQPVADDALLRILAAARLAPSACNKQPWHFYVIRDEAIRRELFTPEKQGWAAEAPVTIVACSRPAEAWVRWADKKNHADIDLAITFEHLVLAATEEGLGTCWICAFDPEHFRKVLKLPEGLEPVAATPLGHAQNPSAPRPRKGLEEIITWL